MCWHDVLDVKKPPFSHQPTVIGVLLSYIHAMFLIQAQQSCVRQLLLAVRGSEAQAALYAEHQTVNLLVYGKSPLLHQQLWKAFGFLGVFFKPAFLGSCICNLWGVVFPTHLKVSGNEWDNGKIFVVLQLDCCFPHTWSQSFTPHFTHLEIGVFWSWPVVLVIEQVVTQHSAAFVNSSAGIKPQIYL